MKLTDDPLIEGGHRIGAREQPRGERIDIANLVLRDTYRNENKSYVAQLQNRKLSSVRRAIVNAKRFMLDESMSEFLAHLATAPFNVAMERLPDVLSSLRHSAIPPFDIMFVQVDNRAFRRGLRQSDSKHGKRDAYGQLLIKEDSPDILDEIGWLIENDGDAVYMTEFFLSDQDDLMTPPFRWMYRYGDNAIREAELVSVKAGMFAHGIQNYIDPCVAVSYSRPLDSFPPNQITSVERGMEKFRIHFTCAEYGSTLRYLFAFLATLNNVPKVNVENPNNRHFIGGGQRRKYLDHTVLTLHMPARQTMKRLANRLIAQARRGWHIVRPHWRLAHPVLGARYCATREHHLWTAKDETGHATCTQCPARRVWIVLPEGRGDPTLSVRTHTYLATHRR